MDLREEAERIRQKLDELDEVQVRIALFGQPGSGKSSLINRLVGQELAKVGVQNDTTVAREAYEWNGLFLCDLPGYDTERFPAASYFERFEVLSFDLLLCVTSGKLHSADAEFFRRLQAAGKTCLFVRNKADQLWEPGRSEEELRASIERDTRIQLESPALKVHFTSCRTPAGLGDLIEAIHDHLEPAKKERWAREAAAFSKDFLDVKHSACDRYVTLAAGLAAINGMNPVPGADIAVDLSIIVGLFVKIRHAYGLSAERLEVVEQMIPAAAPIVNHIVKFVTKDGVLLLLKRIGPRVAIKEGAKWIPLVGQVVAASLGFWITKAAGDYYHKQCHEIARQMLAACVNEPPRI